MVIILTSGGHLEFLCMYKNISYDKNMQTCFFGMQSIYLIANLNIYFEFPAQNIIKQQPFLRPSCISQIPQGCHIGTRWIINLDPLMIQNLLRTAMHHQILGSVPHPLIYNWNVHIQSICLKASNNWDLFIGTSMKRTKRCLPKSTWPWSFLSSYITFDQQTGVCTNVCSHDCNKIWSPWEIHQVSVFCWPSLLSRRKRQKIMICCMHPSFHLVASCSTLCLTLEFTILHLF